MYCLVDMCCVCLNMESGLRCMGWKDGEDVTYTEKLSSFRLRFKLDDPVRMICNACSYRLDVSYDFYRQCVRSENVLNGYLDQLKANDNVRGRLHVTIRNNPIAKTETNNKRKITNSYPDTKRARLQSEYLNQIQQLKLQNLYKQEEIDYTVSPLQSLETFVSTLEERLSIVSPGVFEQINVFELSDMKIRNSQLDLNRQLDSYDPNKDIYYDDSDDDSVIDDYNPTGLLISNVQGNYVDFDSVQTDNYDIASTVSESNDLIAKKPRFYDRPIVCVTPVSNYNNIGKLETFMSGLSQRLDREKSDRVLQCVVNDYDHTYINNIKKLEEISNKLLGDTTNEPIRSNYVRRRDYQRNVLCKKKFNVNVLEFNKNYKKMLCPTRGRVRQFIRDGKPFVWKIKKNCLNYDEVSETNDKISQNRHKNIQNTDKNLPINGSVRNNDGSGSYCDRNNQNGAVSRNEIVWFDRGAWSGLLNLYGSILNEDGNVQKTNDQNDDRNSQNGPNSNRSFDRNSNYVDKNVTKDPKAFSNALNKLVNNRKDPNIPIRNQNVPREDQNKAIYVLKRKSKKNRNNSVENIHLDKDEIVSYLVNKDRDNGDNFGRNDAYNRDKRTNRNILNDLNPNNQKILAEYGVKIEDDTTSTIDKLEEMTMAFDNDRSQPTNVLTRSENVIESVYIKQPPIEDFENQPIEFVTVPSTSQQVFETEDGKSITKRKEPRICDRHERFVEDKTNKCMSCEEKFALNRKNDLSTHATS